MTNAVDENGTVLLPYDTVPPPQPTFNSGRKAGELFGLFRYI